MIKQVSDDKKFIDVRLPGNIVPSHYELSLKPDLEKFTFTGSVKIDYVAKDASRIVLHALDLEITEGFVENRESKNEIQKIETVTYSKATETAIFDFDKPVPTNGSLFLKFNGCLNDKLRGFYRLSFDVDGVQVYAATTQFESTDARRCFPCWDEPAFKATFSVNLVVNPKLQVKDRSFDIVALSNTPEISRTPIDNLLDIKYGITPVMSTYLLAFIVGPFEYIEASDGKRPIRVYTTPGKTDQGQFSLDMAVKCLKFYEDYFGIEYPLAKMDLIGIPDFSFGAMENWGLVIYRDTCLLVDPMNTSTVAKQYVAVVVAHELAHQWFGNLVTMEWWTHLWLNEGFATFMQYFCSDIIYPEYELWPQFVSGSIERALSLDALHNSHAIEVPVKDPAEINEIFDIISYVKGASVIRMLYNYIGDDCFRKGMNDYLSKFSYKNTMTEDLWHCLGASSNKPVAEMMSGWTSKKGFPWLSVAYSEEGDSIKLTLKQTKFTSDGKLPADEVDYKWQIPVSYTTGADPVKVIDLGLMVDRETVFTIPKTDSWIKLNPSSTGVYRVAYPKEMISKLYPAISNQTLSPVDRLSLVIDCFALCKAGKVSSVDYLKLLTAFEGQNETNHNVWKTIDSSVAQLSTLIASTDYQHKLHAFGRKLYSDIYKKLTWNTNPNEKHVDGMTRALVINRLISFGDQEVIKEALNRFMDHIDKKNAIPGDLREAVYKAVAIYGDESQFNSLFELYKISDSSEEKNNISTSLGFSKDMKRIERTMNFIMSDEVRISDKLYVFHPICATSPYKGWELFKQHKDYFIESYSGSLLMKNLVKFSTDYFGEEDKAQEVEKFFEVNKFPGAERTIQQSLESIRIRAEWLRRDSESMKSFFSSME